MKAPERFYIVVLVSALVTFLFCHFAVFYSDVPLVKFDQIYSKQVGLYREHDNMTTRQHDWYHTRIPANLTRYDEIRIAVVACNDRLEETLTMLKSAILFSISPLRIFAFADENLSPKVERQLTEWREIMNGSFAFEMWPISMPIAEPATWRELFRPCSAQRLFIPTLLQNVDSVVYLDSDTLFLGPLEALWDQFSLMNSSQMAAMTNESNFQMHGFYTTHRKHPVYGDYGVNAGVLLMNLTRMRDFDWQSFILPAYTAYYWSLTLGDQDIINIIFGTHPEKLLVMPCRFNYRTEHCVDGCDGILEDGALVVHGNRMAFHETGRLEGLEAVYSAIRDYTLGTDPYTELLVPMRQNLESKRRSSCGKVREIFKKSIEKHLEKPTIILNLMADSSNLYE